MDTQTVAVYLFITMITIWMSELNLFHLYPACSKLNYNASEADCCESAMSLFPTARTSLSLSLSFPARTHLSLSVPASTHLFLSFPARAHLSLSVSVLFFERLKGAALSVKSYVASVILRFFFLFLLDMNKFFKKHLIFETCLLFMLC